jgi:hypothetical protein
MLSIGPIRVLEPAGPPVKVLVREWARWGSNPRPSDYESPALTTELQARLNLLVRGHYRPLFGCRVHQHAVSTAGEIPGPLLDWWDDYARSLRRRDRSEQTADLYRRSYERFWRWAIDQGLPADPAAVSTAIVNRWVDNLRGTVARGTVPRGRDPGDRLLVVATRAGAG